jgi:hypothetical protein
LIAPGYSFFLSLRQNQPIWRKETVSCSRSDPRHYRTHVFASLAHHGDHRVRRMGYESLFGPSISEQGRHQLYVGVGLRSPQVGRMLTLSLLARSSLGFWGTFGVDSTEAHREYNPLWGWRPFLMHPGRGIASLSCSLASSFSFLPVWETGAYSISCKRAHLVLAPRIRQVSLVSFAVKHIPCARLTHYS